ncbi:CatB-related O-acetyltransferase [soil metagenome]
MTEPFTGPARRLHLPPGRLNYTATVFADQIAKLGWRIGDHTYGTPDIRWLGEPARLSIGKFCSIADGVKLFLGSDHRTDWVTTYPFSHVDIWPEGHGIEGHPGTRGDVIIGNDVWLASGCTVLSGVTIGDGAVVGAHAVVRRDVEPYGIVSGNPAAMVRKRFDDATIEKLRDMAWWDWAEADINKAVPKLLSADVEGLYDDWLGR